MRTTPKAFTLIELIIVVGIIAILSGIATSNVLEAQTRSKVSAARNDLRVLTTAIESYAVDHGRYMPASGTGDCYMPPLAQPVSRRLYPLTTPVSYLGSVPRDKFQPKGSVFGGSELYDTYDYVDAAATDKGSGLTSGGAWRVASAGPDMCQTFGGRTLDNIEANARGVDYDPTNGTVSAGDIVAVGPLHTALGNPLDPTNPNRPGIVRVPAYIEQW